MSKNNTGIKNSTNSGMLNVLVIGDWIIDEDWVMMIERSSSSANQMDEKHYHTTFSDINISTTRLCGASLTASAIRAFFQSRPSDYELNCNVYGMGVWHPNDDAFVDGLFRKDTLGLNPFRISTPQMPEIHKDKEKRLFNLARSGDRCATMRIVRTFLGGNLRALPTPMARYDWNVKWEPSIENSESNLKQTILNRIKENYTDMQKPVFDAVVLSDFNKGLINEDFIKSLVTVLKDSPNFQKQGLTWFYRTKQSQSPEWTNILGEYIEETGGVLVQFIDPRMALKHSEGKPMMCGSILTQEGLDVIDQHKYDRNIKQKTTILFNDNSVISHDATNDKSWVIRSNEKPEYLTRGRSSIFLATLVVMELLGANSKENGEKKHNQKSFGENCAIGLANGVKWCSKCKTVWERENSDVAVVSADIEQAIEYTDRADGINISSAYSHEKLKNDWKMAKDAKHACGCIDSESKFELQVWRAHTLLNKYTVVSDERKELIINLCNSIRNFLDLDEKDKIRPQFSLIEATPGSGKSYLAKCIADHFNLELFECNIAQMTSLHELSNFFDKVGAAQRENQKVFVFIDEVDNRIKQESVFGYLLDMMWCGHYYREGLKNELKPFPALLAMSTDANGHDKLPDLKSRIYGIYGKLDNYSSEEKIYLFANLIERYFSQIAYVDMAILDIVKDLNLNYGPRSLELFISKFQNVNRNEITIANLPSTDTMMALKEHFSNKENGKLKYQLKESKKNKKVVKLIYDIPNKYT